MKYLILFAFLASCSAVPVQPPDPTVVADIAAACAGSGLFKMVDGSVTALVPVAALPVALVNAGVDLVCANPAKFASDASTAEWVIKNIAVK